MLSCTLNTPAPEPLHSSQRAFLAPHGCVHSSLCSSCSCLNCSSNTTSADGGTNPIFSSSKDIWFPRQIQACGYLFSCRGGSCSLHFDYPPSDVGDGELLTRRPSFQHLTFFRKAHCSLRAEVVTLTSFNTVKRKLISQYLRFLKRVHRSLFEVVDLVFYI